jgi:transposase-like protein
MSQNATLTERKLTVRQYRAIGILASGSTVEAVAEQVGVSRQTVHKWMTRPDFKAAIDEARRLVIQTAFDSMSAIVSKAVTAIKELLESPIPMIRLRSAELVLRFCRENVEIAALVERLKRIESRLNQQ